jgi:hypothetical protein
VGQGQAGPHPPERVRPASAPRQSSRWSRRARRASAPRAPGGGPGHPQPGDRGLAGPTLTGMGTDPRWSGVDPDDASGGAHTSTEASGHAARYSRRACGTIQVRVRCHAGTRHGAAQIAVMA